jgi:cell division protein ZipA
MMMIDVYFGIAAVGVLTIGAASMIIIRRRRKDEPLNMPKTDGDPLFDKSESVAPNVDMFVGRWGDQVVGKPKVISTETTEERIARIHQEAEQLQAQRQLAQVRQPTVYTPRAVHAQAATHQTTKERIQQNAMVVLYVMAPENHRFSGYELYQSLINAGLIYGKMRIFHYHQQHDSQRPVLFSVASAINPGAIDIDHIGSFSTPGLTLFLDTSRAPNAKAALETMIAVAEQLADDLNGIVLNSKRQQWSTAIETECYAQI